MGARLEQDEQQRLKALSELRRIEFGRRVDECRALAESAGRLFGTRLALEGLQDQQRNKRAAIWPYLVMLAGALVAWFGTESGVAIVRWAGYAAILLVGAWFVRLALDSRTLKQELADNEDDAADVRTRFLAAGGSNDLWSSYRTVYRDAKGQPERSALAELDGYMRESLLMQVERA